MVELTQREYEIMKQMLEDGDEYGAYLVSVEGYPEDGGMNGEGMLSTLRMV